MAQGEHHHHIKRLVLVWQQKLFNRFLLDHFYEFFIMKVHVCYIFRNLSLMGVIPICWLTDWHVLKIHMVLCEGSSLVWKYMLNLSQLLIQWACLNDYLCWFCCVKFRVAYVDSLDVLYHFQRHNQRNWYEIRKQ